MIPRPLLFEILLGYTVVGSYDIDPADTSLSYAWELISAPTGTVYSVQGFNNLHNIFAPANNYLDLVLDAYTSDVKFIFRLHVSDGKTTATAISHLLWRPMHRRFPYL